MHPDAVTFRGVVLDWRGTLVCGPSERERVRLALTRLGRGADPQAVGQVVAAVAAADGPEHRLDAPGMDADAAVHRSTFLAVLADAGLDRPLAEALHAVESDVRLDTFADDVAPTLGALRAAGLRLAVLSDIHVDVRPAFRAAGLEHLVDAYVLSFEQGLQKPDPELYARTLQALGTRAGETLMVGDRAGPDGGAVEHGMVTLLLPPLEHPGQRRLHHVLALTGVARGAAGAAR